MDIVHKTCSAEYCQYKTYGVFPGCSYDGYCDFQTPRDSRMQPLTPTWMPPIFGPPPSPLPSSDCPICGKPAYECHGHTTCLGDL